MSCAALYTVFQYHHQYNVFHIRCTYRDIIYMYAYRRCITYLYILWFHWGGGRGCNISVVSAAARSDILSGKSSDRLSDDKAAITLKHEIIIRFHTTSMQGTGYIILCQSYPRRFPAEGISNIISSCNTTLHYIHFYSKTCSLMN